MTNAEAVISPGKYTEAYAEKQLKHRKYFQEKIKLPSQKRRRLVLKQERAVTKGAMEASEGVSYQSGIGHEENVDIEQIPSPVSKGYFKPIPRSPQDSIAYITFDLETTDLIREGRIPHITQVAAAVVHSAAQWEFNCYVLPKIPQSQEAQRVSGITVSLSGVLMVNGKEVETETIDSAVSKFLDWLKFYKKVILIAHNGENFDFPVFMTALASVNRASEFCDIVIGFVDSLPLLKKIFPGQSSYKQENLVSNLLAATYGAHNALEDVRSLGWLIKHEKVTDKHLQDFTFSPEAVKNQLTYNR